MQRLQLGLQHPDAAKSKRKKQAKKASEKSKRKKQAKKDTKKQPKKIRL